MMSVEKYSYYWFLNLSLGPMGHNGSICDCFTNCHVSSNHSMKTFFNDLYYKSLGSYSYSNSLSQPSNCSDIHSAGLKTLMHFWMWLYWYTASLLAVFPVTSKRDHYHCIKKPVISCLVERWRRTEDAGFWATSFDCNIRISNSH